MSGRSLQSNSDRLSIVNFVTQATVCSSRLVITLRRARVPRPFRERRTAGDRAAERHIWTHLL